MRKFKKGDRVNIIHTDGYWLTNKERKGTVTSIILGGALIEVSIDGSQTLSFNPDALELAETLVPQKKAVVKFLGITILTIEGDL
jgi:hypothetical protein